MTRSLLILSAVSLTLVACGASDGSPGGATAVAAVTTSSKPTATSSTSVLDPKAAVAQAVDTFQGVGRYRLEARLVVSIREEPTVFEIVGWVDGQDRELVLTGGGNEVITRVVDGTATVERDGVVSEVPLKQAEEAPSIEILLVLRSLAFTSAAGEVTGTLTAAALEASGFDVDGVADVTVRLGGDLGVAGYTMTGRNSSWSVEVRFLRLDGEVGD